LNLKNLSRILYFSRDYTTHDHRFLSALEQTGHEIFYLRLESRGHAQESRPVPAKVRQVGWAGGRGPFTWGALPRLLASLRGVLRQVQPDLVQAGPLQTAAFLTALSGFRPLVSVSWGYDLIFDAHKNALYRFLTRYTLRRSAVMVGDSAVVRRLAVSYGMPDECIVTFPWGVDLEHFRPLGEPETAPEGTQEGRPESAPSGGSTLPDSPPAPFTLLSTRGWEPIYGVELIARAFVEAARQRPELRLVMLGSGSLAPRLREIFQRGGVSERVLFPGQVSQGDLPRYYRSAGLYLSASRSDGTSISLLEALACGCPALVSDIPGNREWITPGVEGWWFPDGDEGALAQGILQAVEERPRLAWMGRAARRLAEARADWEKNFQGLLKAYALAGSREHR
jgi:glycosyltransferase involved in cell wall biosynthesis